MRESKNLEFKEKITNTFLKTVSAYANYGSGEILFGISDNGTVIGIDKPEDTCLDIENRINDSIDPVPEYSLEIINDSSTIKLTVFEGIHKPYLYKAKAYRRNDSATIEVDRLELTRLILEGTNVSYEELPAKTQDLKFDVLANKLRSVLNLQSFSDDTLKTLELFNSEKGYNIAAELLADQNSFCGVEMVRFDNSINTICDRETYTNISILLQFDHALKMYQRYYQREKIEGASRETYALIPEEAFREATANALVHRTWDVDANINIAMYNDRIEITSPGGLPSGINEEDYRSGGISILRNRIIGTVFLRLKMIEHFGTGIRRIIESYSKSDKKPVFKVTENSIRITLPVISGFSSFSKDENAVFSLLKERPLASSAIAEATGFGKSKTVSILNKLVDEGYARTIGNGRGLKYTTD